MNDTALSLPRGGFMAVILRCLLNGLNMQTTLEILLINTKAGTSRKTGAAYSISEAHCVLRNDKGEPGGVGVLTIPKSLEAVASVGTFRGTFGLEAPTYGENAGKVVAVLTGLEAIPVRAPLPAKGL